MSDSSKESLIAENQLLRQQVVQLNHQLVSASGSALEDNANSLLLQVLSSSPGTAIITDKDGIVLYENNTIRELWKYREGETSVGLNLLEIPPARKVGLDVAIADVVSGKKSEVFIGGVSYNSVISGEIAYVNVAVIPRNSGADIVGSIVQLTEITDVELSNQLNEKIYSHCPIGIMIFDTSGVVIKHNRAVGKNLGNPDIDLVGVKLFELSSLKPYVDILKESVRGIPSYGVRFEFISVFTKKDVHLNVWLIPILRGEKIDKVMLLEHDITAQITAENALIKLARTDDLTGLVNRREIKERLSYEVSRLDRIGGVFSIIISDIDHFKRINDRYGHLVGDSALKSIARTLEEHVREIDMVARWGGEEFLIFLPGADTDTAKLTAERLRCCVSELAIPIDGIRIQNHTCNATEELESTNDNPDSALDTVLSATMSFGVFSYSKGVPLDTALKYADQCLYEAKERGRNQVVCYECR